MTDAALPSARSFSVVIPALNEEQWLPALLDRLDAQTLRPNEIVVADAHSTDNTAHLARSRGARVVPGGRPAAGRNAGAAATSGEVIIFLDADAQPEPDFLERALAEFTERGLDLAAVPVAPVETDLDFRLACGVTEAYLRAMVPFSPHAPGLCILVTRRLHEALDGFDESLLMGEDHDYARRGATLGRYGLLRSVKARTSMRRIEKDGWLKFGAQTLYAEALVQAGRPIRELPFTYEFGAFGEERPPARPSLADRWRGLRRQLAMPSTERHGDALAVMIMVVLIGLLATALLWVDGSGGDAWMATVTVLTPIAALAGYVLARKPRYETGYGPFVSTAVAVASDTVHDHQGNRLITAGRDVVCELHLIRGRRRMAELHRRGRAGRLAIVLGALEGAAMLADDLGHPRYREVTYLTARADPGLARRLREVGFVEVPAPGFDLFNRVEKWVLMRFLSRIFGYRRETDATAFRLLVMTRERFARQETRAAIASMADQTRRELAAAEGGPLPLEPPRDSARHSRRHADH